MWTKKKPPSSKRQKKNFLSYDGLKWWPQIPNHEQLQMGYLYGPTNTQNPNTVLSQTSTHFRIDGNYRSEFLQMTMLLIFNQKWPLFLFHQKKQQSADIRSLFCSISGWYIEVSRNNPQKLPMKLWIYPSILGENRTHAFCSSKSIEKLNFWTLGVGGWYL